MTDSTPQPVTVARFYTRARKFPILVGRFNGGEKIWGGPYTLPQLVAMTLTFLVMLGTRFLWTSHSPIVDFPVAIAIAYFAGWGVARLPAPRRNALNVVSGYLNAYFATPAGGTVRGRPLTASKPHVSHADAVICWANEPGIQPDPVVLVSPTIEPTTSGKHRADPVQPRRLPQTAIQRLLDQTSQSSQQQ